MLCGRVGSKSVIMVVPVSEASDKLSLRLVVAAELGRPAANNDVSFHCSSDHLLRGRSSRRIALREESQTTIQSTSASSLFATFWGLDTDWNILLRHVFRHSLQDFCITIVNLQSDLSCYPLCFDGSECSMELGVLQISESLPKLCRIYSVCGTGSHFILRAFSTRSCFSMVRAALSRLLAIRESLGLQIMEAEQRTFRLTDRLITSVLLLQFLKPPNKLLELTTSASHLGALLAGLLTISFAQKSFHCYDGFVSR
jgi:hypothetical protein